VQEYGLKKRVEPVKACRTVRKSDMKFNDKKPKMKVDPERYVSFQPFGAGSAACHASVLCHIILTVFQTVEADGEICTAEPSETLPLSQAYFLF
jgi:urease